jgi:flagellar basal-body rod protein FlgB
VLAEILNSGAIPALEASLRFAGARHRLIAHNIANLDTPGFIQKDVPPAAFQKALSEAIDRRRQRLGGMAGDLELNGGRDFAPGQGGALTLHPQAPIGGILFHDRNNRDLERLMQDHAENAAVYRMSAELLRSRYQMLREAISERV